MKPQSNKTLDTARRCTETAAFPRRESLELNLYLHKKICLAAVPAAHLRCGCKYLHNSTRAPTFTSYITAMTGPVDRKLVQSILKADLKGAVAQHGEAWFLSVRSCWPACSEHGDYIDAIEARAANAHLGPPCAASQALPGKSYDVEIPKVAVFEVGDDAVAWLEQVESVCTLARFAKPAWCALAAASMAETPLKC